jgi:hypothetical protein
MLRLVMLVVWTSFLAAVVAEGCFFSLFDPHEMLLGGHQIDLSPLAAYTIGFFIFWLFCSLASGLTCYLISVPGQQQNAED